jgi:hypothetical protein
MIGEQTEQPFSATEETLKIAKESGLEDIIKEVSNEQDIHDPNALFDIPIPPVLIAEEKTPITVNESLKGPLNELLDIIKDKEKGKEYPFLLTGSSKDEDGMIKDMKFTFNIQYLKNNYAEINPELLQEGIQNGVNNNYDTYIICHTHPNIQDEEKQKMLASKISPELKEKFGIKEAGLNFSLQDLRQLVAFNHRLKDRLPPNSTVYMAVLMHNGAFEAVHIENGKFKRKRIEI